MTGPEGQPLEDLVGKSLLFALDYTDVDGRMVNREEYLGRIISADGDKLRVEVPSEGVFTFPLQVHPAPPGNYTIQATGEVVINPDFFAHWTVPAPPDV